MGPPTDHKSNRFMDSTIFVLDWWALFFILLASGGIFFLRKRFYSGEKPHLRFSQLAELTIPHPSLRVRLAGLPKQLFFAALFFFCLAFVDPHFLVKKGLPDFADSQEDRAPEIKEVELPTEGIALYFVLDRSGSMQKEVSLISPGGKRYTLTRLEYLKRVTSQFIRGDRSLGLGGRPNDLVGMVSFARTAHVLSPLTLDHEELLSKLSDLQVVDQQTYDGTAMGYAVFKTVNLIAATKHFAEELIKEGKPAYEIKSTVVVLVTDGLQNTHPDDRAHPLRSQEIQQAAEYAEKQGVRLYIVDIEPAILQARFSPFLKQMQESAERTGGRFYVADQGRDLLDIYSEIDGLEKSRLPRGKQLLAEVRARRLEENPLKDYRRIDLYPYLIALGLMALLGASVLQTTYLRRAL